MSTQRQLANCIRALTMDAVQQAGSGHAGAPMGLADIAEVLWRDYLKHNPGNPLWPDRDRFVLSNGHACMLLYSVLYLTGYPLGLDDLKKFRQLGSRTAGHPERHPSIGIETTTGPLGQGVGNAVGMALAENMLAAQFNRPDFPIVDHYTYFFCSDGDLMEGVSHEACSLAGALRVRKLIGFYDDNGISIDGKVEGWYRDDTPKRFEAYGWHVIPPIDGQDAEAVSAAIREARAESDRPTLICCRTIIGFGAPDIQGTKAAHSDPLGADEIAKARKQLGWPYPPFVIPPEMLAEWDRKAQGAAAESRWRELHARYRQAYPDLAAEFDRRMRGDLPVAWSDIVGQTVAQARAETKPLATRASSQAALNSIAPVLPELVGGSADLTTSNSTQNKASRVITPDDISGNYIHYGVREFGMTTAMNGLALHGGLIPYGGTFLVFSDYARNAVRLACLMGAHVVLVYSHDSIGLGEDGPTHQPIEQLSSLRAMPGLTLWRPCDAVETAAAWTAAIEHKDGPTALALTRQGLPQQSRTQQQIDAIRRGGYVLIDCQGTPECLVLATGSEVSIAAEAVRELNAAGRRVRLISMPCTERFDAQDAGYRESVLPRAIKRRLAVEAGAHLSWCCYVGNEGRVIGIDRFGASGKGPAVFAYFGFTAANVKSNIEELLTGSGTAQGS